MAEPRDLEDLVGADQVVADLADLGADPEDKVDRGGREAAGRVVGRN